MPNDDNYIPISWVEFEIDKTCDLSGQVTYSEALRLMLRNWLADCAAVETPYEADGGGQDEDDYL